MQTIMTDVLERKATKLMTNTNSTRRLLDNVLANHGQYQQPDIVCFIKLMIEYMPDYMPIILIDFRDFVFYYVYFQVLKNINSDIEEKKVTAFIGLSGCGKSTLLRNYNRMYDLYSSMQTKGEINLD